MYMLFIININIIIYMLCHECINNGRIKKNLVLKFE